MKLKYIIIIFLAISIPATLLMGTSAGGGKFLNVERFIDNNPFIIILLIAAAGIGVYVFKSKERIETTKSFLALVGMVGGLLLIILSRACSPYFDNWG